MNIQPPIPAPVPPAQPTDPTKMDTRAMAQDLWRCVWNDLPSLPGDLDRMVAALDRHLQPLAGQNAKAVQVLREAMGEAVEDETLLGMAHLIVSQRDNAYNESKELQRRLTGIITDLRAQLTSLHSSAQKGAEDGKLVKAARELLDAVVTERDGLIGEPLAFRDTNLQFEHVLNLSAALRAKPEASP